MADAPSSSIAVQEAALRNAYAAGDPERCAIHHLNLSNHLEHASSEPALYLAHRLAAGVLCFQAGLDLLPTALGDLAVSLAQTSPPKPPLPDSFDELCQIVQQVEGVRFREMVEQLAEHGGADGDEAMHAVVGMAQRMAGGA